VTAGTVRLGDVCDVVMGQAPQGSSYNTEGEGLPLLAGAGDLGEIEPAPTRFTSAPTRVAEPSDIILCVRATLGKTNWARREYCLGRGVAALRAHTSELDSAYLWHWMGTQEGTLERKARGSTFRQVTRSAVESLRIPLPPLPEQQRIAAILDKADALRRKRQQTLDLADQFLRSAFLDLFGDPVTNPKGWPVVRLANLIDGPVRNGLSPSKSGTHAGEVLTLAAITGGQFRAERRKTAFFDIKPPLEKMVDARDFLICRGNGNIDLVGRACFPAESMPGVLFPDTMIGFRINTDTVAKAYLHLAWETKAVRNQIVTKSRTTSGIHKVNQQTLKTISLPLPPFEEQTRFEQLASKIHTTKKNLTSTDTDALLGSLVQRAFRGDL